MHKERFTTVEQRKGLIISNRSAVLFIAVLIILYIHNIAHHCINYDSKNGKNKKTSCITKIVSFRWREVTLRVVKRCHVISSTCFFADQ